MQVYPKVIDSIIDFYSMSTCLGLFHAQKLENHVPVKNE